MAQCKHQVSGYYVCSLCDRVEHFDHSRCPRCFPRLLEASPGDEAPEPVSPGVHRLAQKSASSGNVGVLSEVVSSPSIVVRNSTSIHEDFSDPAVATTGLSGLSWTSSPSMSTALSPQRPSCNNSTTGGSEGFVEFDESLSDLRTPSNDASSPGCMVPVDPSLSDVRLEILGNRGNDEDDTSCYQFKIRSPYLFAKDLSAVSALNDGPSLRQANYLFDSSVPRHIMLSTNMALLEDVDIAQVTSINSSHGVRSEGIPQTTARSLVESIWWTARSRIEGSKQTLLDMRGNALAARLLAMPPLDTLEQGMIALTEMVNGRTCTSPLSIVCYIHLVYTFSLVVYENDIQRQSQELFAQVLSYIACVPRSERQSFIGVIDSLWRPTYMTTADVSEIVRHHMHAPEPMSHGSEVTSTTILRGDPQRDPMLFIAQYMLDGKVCQCFKSALC